ncbi:MAG: biliverdin-producing heme oxygenase [Chitinophagaceae bacterium]
MLSESLKQATRIPHAELEKLMIERIRRTSTTTAYLDLLRLFYGYYKPVEEQIDRFIDRNHLADYSSRRKSAAIVSDMQQLNSDHYNKLCRDLPSINNSSQSFGALYVLEGSTLGGRIIAQMLEKNMGSAAPASFSFFNGYGESAGTMWSVFKDKLNGYTSDTGEQDEIVAAATDTFVKFKKWMISYE